MAVSLLKARDVINVACAMVVDNRPYDKVLKIAYADFISKCEEADDPTPQMFVFFYLAGLTRIRKEDIEGVAAFLTKFYHQYTVANFMKEFRKVFADRIA